MGGIELFVISRPCKSTPIWLRRSRILSSNHSQLKVYGYDSRGRTVKYYRRTTYCRKNQDLRNRIPYSTPYYRTSREEGKHSECNRFNNWWSWNWSKRSRNPATKLSRSLIVVYEWSTLRSSFSLSLSLWPAKKCRVMRCSTTSSQTYLFPLVLWKFQDGRWYGYPSRWVDTCWLLRLDPGAMW